MGAPQLQYAIPAGGGVPVGVAGTGTVNRLTKWSAATTIGDSGVSDDGATVSFVARNLSSSAAQTWTLASSASALNIQSGLLNLDTANGRVGIGTTSPAAPLHVNGNQIAGVGASVTPYAQGLFGPSSAYTMWWKTGATAGGGLIGAAGPSIYFYVASGTPNAPTLLQVANFDSTGNFFLGAATGVSIQAAGTNQGLKLPATPGNADSQTLDAYNQNTTWTPTVTWGTGGTVTTTSAVGAYTQIGNVVTFTVTISYNCTVIPTGGSLTVDLPRPSAAGFSQRPGSWAFNSLNGVAGTNFVSIGSGVTTASLRVATGTALSDVAIYLTVTSGGALVVTCTYLAS